MRNYPLHKQHLAQQLKNKIILLKNCMKQIIIVNNFNCKAAPFHPHLNDEKSYFTHSLRNTKSIFLNKKPFYLQVERLTVTIYINIIIGMEQTIYNSTSFFLLSRGYQRLDKKIVRIT